MITKVEVRAGAGSILAASLLGLGAVIFYNPDPKLRAEAVETQGVSIGSTLISNNFEEAGLPGAGVSGGYTSPLTIFGMNFGSEEIIPIICKLGEEDLEKLIECNGPVLDLYSEISQMPKEFVAAQLFHESRMNPFIGQGKGFGRGQLHYGPFIDTMHALVQRPDVKGPGKGLTISVLERQSAFEESVSSNLQDSALGQYIQIIDGAIGESFSLSGYQDQIQENIIAYTGLNDRLKKLTTRTEENPTPWFTNGAEITRIKKQKRGIVSAQRSLNDVFDTALDSFWSDYITWDNEIATDVKNKKDEHQWYEIDSNNLPEDYVLVTDILTALNMRRVYSDAWSQDELNPDSNILERAVLDYRIGPKGKPNQGHRDYAEEVIGTYQTLLE